MNLTGKLLKIAGKEDIQLDARISTWYIFRLCWKYGWMKIRGITQVTGEVYIEI